MIPRPNRATAVAAVFALLAASACRADRPPADVTSMPPVSDAPVGPIPGAAEVQAYPANPYAGNKQAIAEGRRYFVQYNCAGCHGDHGGGGMGPSLRDEDWLYGGVDAQITNSIAQGRSFGMPAWGQALTSAQMWQIAAYLKSMRTPLEAEPPR